VDVADNGLTGTDIDESTLDVSGTAGPRGATGAQGPQGNAGPTGATGPAGTPGANGSPDSGAQILAKLLGVDGPGSGLDADQLDGQSSAAFAAAGHTHSGGSGGTIVDGTITDADISPTAAIAESKLATQMGVMTGRVNNLDAAGPPVFGAVSGITDATATETNVSTRAPSIATVASRFSVWLTAPAGSGQTRAVTLRVNGSDTLSCDFGGPTQIGCVTIGPTAAIPANAELTLQIDSSGAPAAADVLLGFVLR
jgi:hypothetical protein